MERPLSSAWPAATSARDDRAELATEPATEIVTDLMTALTDEAFDAFYRREFVRIRTLARALVGGPLSDDIAQEAMLVAFRRWPEVRRMNDPAMWVRRVCANLATSQVRRRIAEAKAMARLGARSRTTVTLSESDDEFWAAVRSLPRRQAQVVALHYLCDLSVVDVAATLRLKPGSVKAHLSRARASLSGRFEQSQAEGQ